MDYRCPHCHRMLDVRKLYLKDISACAKCGQKVVLGDFLAFAVAALAMPVSTLSTLYLLSHQFDDYFVAAGYAVAIGMVTGILVLLALGRATPFRGRARSRKSSARRGASANPAAEPQVESVPQDDAFAPTRVL